MNVPWLHSCGSVTLVDLLALESRTLDKIASVRGYVCRCGAFVPVRIETLLFQDAEQRMRRYSPDQDQYQFLLKKLVRKAVTLMVRYYN